MFLVNKFFVENPFYINGTRNLDGSFIALLVVGIFFIILGFVPLIFINRTKDKVAQYKKEQLEDFVRNNPKKKHFTYEQAGLYLPGSMKAYAFWPVFTSLLLFIIGFSFVLGKTLISL